MGGDRRCTHAPATTTRRPSPDASAHHAIDAVGDRLVLGAALAELPDEFRVAVVLRDVGDLDYAEIATVLGVPVGTVKSRDRTRAGDPDRPAREPQRPPAASNG